MTTMPALVARCEELSGSNELFVLAHDLRSLHRLGGPDETIHNSELLATLLRCEPAIFAGDVYQVFPDHSFPLLVARNPTTGSSSPADAALAGVLLSHNRLLFEQIEKLRRPSNMSVAAQLQRDQLQIRAAQLGTFHIAATLEPTATVAGDMYDMALTPAGIATMLSMDAMGHGVHATLAASLALAAIRNTRRAGGSMVDQAEAADRALIDEYDGATFVTMVLVELSAHGVEVINAGHEPVRRGTATDGFTTLDLPADPPLGLDGPTNYRVNTLPPLVGAERLCLLSDGASGARNPVGEAFGDTGVNDILRRHADAPPLLAAHDTGQAVLSHCKKLKDDLTVMIACSAI